MGNVNSTSDYVDDDSLYKALGIGLRRRIRETHDHVSDNKKNIALANSRILRLEQLFFELKCSQQCDKGQAESNNPNLTRWPSRRSQSGLQYPRFRIHDSRQ